MEISQGTLSNGIRVVTTELSDSAAVAFHIYFGCGGRHERDEVVGVSHALEHMIFKGTPTRNTLEIARQTVLQAAQGVGDGRIDVSPLVEKKCLACGTCEFRPVCRFDRAFNDPRDAASHLPSAGRIGGDA